MKQGMLFILLLMIGTSMFAACPNHVVRDSVDGKDFWFAFIPAIEVSKNKDAQLRVSIIAEQKANVTITGLQNFSSAIHTSSPFTEQYTIPAHSFREITLDKITNITEWNKANPKQDFVVITNNSYHIQSDVPIAVIAGMYHYCLSDECRVLPKAQLGTEYIIQTPEADVNDATVTYNYPEIVVVATEDNTLVKFTPSEKTGGSLNGKPYKITINAGQTLYISGEKNLSGTRVVSNKPIAVFQGSPGAHVETSTMAYDHVYEQAAPTKMWGTEFATIRTTCNHDVLQITAKNNQTNVYCNQQWVSTLKSGESYNYSLSDASCYVSASDSVEVTQYMTAGSYCWADPKDVTSMYGDPASFVVPPLNQGIRHGQVKFVMGNVGEQSVYGERRDVYVVTDWGTADNMTWEGSKISGFQPLLGSDSLCWWTRQLSPSDATTLHTLRSTSGTFVAYSTARGITEAIAHTVPEIRRDTFVEIFDTTCVVPYMFGDCELDSSGIYEYTFSSFKWTDSIVRLHLTIQDTIFIDTIVSHCKPKVPFVWNGRTLTESGIYIDTLAARWGCDSIVTLYLSIAEPTKLDSSIVLCSRDTPLHWNGRSLTETGVYYDTLPNAGGCDSVITLHLTIVPVRDDTLPTVKVCKNELPYVWEGQSLYETGYYMHEEDVGQGCNSTKTLHFLVNNFCEEPDHPLNPYIDCDTAYTHTYANIKEQELPTFQWNGIPMNTIPHNDHQDTTLVAPLMKADLSCDSIATLHLHVLFPCELPTQTLPVRWSREK